MKKINDETTEDIILNPYKELKTLKIGRVTINNNLLLAPMAGVTDLPFRVLCREHGAGLLGMEMISAKAVLYGNKNTESLLELDPEERPVSLQLFGSDPVIISEIARRIEERPFDILDINMGCPVPKVVNNGEGSALMKQPLLVGKIIEKTVQAISKPVTVKIRKGYSDADTNAVEIAHIAEQSGAAAITVHGRTREQFYAGLADWDIIAAVKDAVKIPVIGNGDVTDGPSAAAMLHKTRCDGIMIGRAARGNPWIFEQVAAYLEEGQEIAKPPLQEVREVILKHAAWLLQYKGEYTGIREMRKHVAWYTAGYPHSAGLRRKVNEIETFAQLEDIIARF